MMDNNYVYVVPNSHYWTDLEQIIRSIEMSKMQIPDGSISSMPEIDIDYILIGLKNTLKHGYNLYKNEN
jgi:hypothetical protein